MKLIPNIDQAWKFLSNWFFIFIGAWNAVSAEDQRAVMSYFFDWPPAAVTLLLVVLGVISRHIDQGLKK